MNNPIMRLLTALLLAGGAVALPRSAAAQSTPPVSDPAASSADLAKKLANPIADLISVPIQFNYDEGFGPEEASRTTVNLQPVIPISLTDNWNVISRTIMPLIYQEGATPLTDDEFGLGDVTQSLFFSPRSSKLIWGAGPVFLLPTATDDSLGSEKWGAGPTGVVLVQDGPWTYGVLANHIWSFAGDDDRADVNATFLQPFLAYTTSAATTFTLNTESTYDWSNDQWTVPINFIVSQLIKFGRQPVSLGVGGRYYAESPDDGPEWGVRTFITFLFPK